MDNPTTINAHNKHIRSTIKNQDIRYSSDKTDITYIYFTLTIITCVGYEHYNLKIILTV